ncbi:hypothetical protein P692DRAFT_20676121, partial [Suillus brevipes Sb2]
THKVFVSYHVSFIESHHASALPLHPGVVLPNPAIPSVPTPPSQRATVEDAPEEPDPLPLPRRSARVPIPSERIRASKDLPYTTTTQRAVIESMAAADRLRALKSPPTALPDEATLAAMVSEHDLAHLAELFA